MKKCSSYRMEHRHSFCFDPCESWQLFSWSMDWAWRTKDLRKVPDLTPYNFLLWCLVKAKSSDHKKEHLLNLSSKYKALRCFLMFCWTVSLYNLVNKANMVHNFLSMFISFLCMFQATMCPSLGEITVSMRRLVYLSLVTNTKCRIDTVVSHDDGHIITRNI
jgi:hypothetical protein